VYGNLVKDAVGKLSRGDLVYPQLHEDRVAEVIRQSLLATAISSSNENKNSKDELNVLEVGVGSEWRVAKRGLYDRGLDEIANQTGVKKIRLTGLDIKPPTDAVLGSITKDIFSKQKIRVDVNAIQGSLTSKNSELLDGAFDCILCFLTLCSVDDELLALTEIKRLLRPNRGVFGYVEHVAVNPDEPYRLLELQQITFDPLQQLVADNCHLHRYTESTILSIFNVGDNNKSANVLSKDRFLVEGMWPVSCQASGIIQRLA
jgi:SAM-dependent methyltransferase